MVCTSGNARGKSIAHIVSVAHIYPISAFSSFYKSKSNGHIVYFHLLYFIPQNFFLVPAYIYTMYLIINRNVNTKFFVKNKSWFIKTVFKIVSNNRKAYQNNNCEEYFFSKAPHFLSHTFFYL